MPELTTSVVVGTQQSPINIYKLATVYSPCLSSALAIDYKNKTAQGYIEADNFIVCSCPKPTMHFRGEEYELIKVHFHACCEHRIENGELADHELHLVHQHTGSTDKLVIAFFFNSGDKVPPRKAFRQWNETLSIAVSSEPFAVGCIPPEKQQLFTLTLSDFIVADLSRWLTYEGSLTSYPFSEDVTWVVNLATEEINSADIEKLKNTEQKTRCIQLLNRRYILRNYDHES